MTFLPNSLSTSPNVQSCYTIKRKDYGFNVDRVIEDSNGIISFRLGPPTWEQFIRTTYRSGSNAGIRIIIHEGDGYETSVACEPMLDTRVDQVVEKVNPYVTETIWLGKPNKLIGRLSMNGYKNDQVTMERARRLMESLSDEYILNLYARYQDNPQIRWKDSIKKVIVN